MKSTFAVLLFIVVPMQAMAASDACEAEPLIFPVYSKDLSKLKQKFIRKFGQFEEITWSQDDIQKYCEQSKRSDQIAPFDKKHMDAFVIDNKCQPHMSKPLSNKRKISHPILAAGRDIIAGGMLLCQIDKNSQKQIYITNRSSRYCFEFSDLKYIVLQLQSSGIPLENMHLKSQNARFCAKTKNRSNKYEKIIENTYQDYGYKNSHVYNGDQFLKINFNKAISLNK